MTNDITKIDKNLEVKGISDKEGMAFFDVRNHPFAVYGLYVKNKMK